MTCWMNNLSTSTDSPLFLNIEMIESVDVVAHTCTLSDLDLQTKFVLYSLKNLSLKSIQAAHIATHKGFVRIQADGEICEVFTVSFRRWKYSETVYMVICIW